MKRSKILCLLLCSIVAIIFIVNAYSQYGYRENRTVQPVFDHKISTARVRVYYVGASTIQLLGINDQRRMGTIIADIDNSLNVHVGFRTDISTWSRGNDTATFKLGPDDIYYERLYYPQVWAVNENLSQSSSTVTVIEYINEILP